MNDTTTEIKKLQLKIWLSKSPMERLRQMMEDNNALLNFWKSARIPSESKGEQSSSNKVVPK